jgi:nitrogen fixation/metabolism regulation signal transduction histidine kinase
MLRRIRQRYTLRIGLALLSALILTVAFGVVLAAHASATEGGALSAVAGVLFVMVLNFGVVGIVVGGNVGIELSRLIRATEEIESGNYDVTIDVDREDELGALGTAFDRMRGSLQAAFSESEEAREEAEAARERAESLADELLVHADAVADSMRAVSEGDFVADAPTDTGIEAIDEIGTAYGGVTEDHA